MNTHQAAGSSLRRCARRVPRPRGSSACSARGASATLKLPHSRQEDVDVAAALGAAAGGFVTAAAGGGRFAGATTFTLSGAIWREIGAGAGAAFCGTP